MAADPGGPGMAATTAGPLPNDQTAAETSFAWGRLSQVWDRLRGRAATRQAAAPLSIVSLVKRTPEELLHDRISAGEYDAALQLALAHNLDSAVVYKARWRAAAISKSSIADNLPKIDDKRWVVRECIQRIAGSAESQLQLLQYGLFETEAYRYLHGQQPASLHDDYRYFIMQRLQLLQYRDRLDAFVAITRGRYVDVEYAAFRGVPLVEYALLLAANCDFHAVEVMWQRFPMALSGSILAILSSIPESTSPFAYATLLPEEQPHSPPPVRRLDWVERTQTCELLHLTGEEADQLYKKHPELFTEEVLRLTRKQPVTPSAVAEQWYIQRALDIDALSGQLEHSLTLLDLGVRRGFQGLQPLRSDVAELTELVYAGRGLHVTLAEYRMLSGYDRFALHLEGATADNVLELVTQSAIPFARKHGGRHVDWLRQYLSDRSKQSIQLAASIFTSTEPADRSNIMPDPRESVEVALDCLYYCENTQEWAVMQSMMARLPKLDGTPGQGPNSPDVRQRVFVAQSHVEAGRLLAQYGLAQAMAFFLDCSSDATAVRQLLRRMLLLCSQRKPPLTDAEWVTVWRDLKTLQEHAFAFVDADYCLIEFCRAVLRAGATEVAKRYLQGTASARLPAARAEQLVLTAARDFISSAHSTDDPAFEKAKQCLAILPASPAAIAERNLLEALQQLPSLGVTLTPSQLRGIPDRMAVVQMALEARPNAHEELPALMELSKRLGLTSLDDRVRTQNLIAQVALQRDDPWVARDLCLGLVRQGYAPVWELCSKLAQDKRITDMDARVEMAAFACTHCSDAVSMDSLLQVWQTLEKHTTAQEFVDTIPMPLAAMEEVGADARQLLCQMSPSCSQWTSEQWEHLPVETLVVIQNWGPLISQMPMTARAEREFLLHVLASGLVPLNVEIVGNLAHTAACSHEWQCAVAYLLSVKDEGIADRVFEGVLKNSELTRLGLEAAVAYFTYLAANANSNTPQVSTSAFCTSTAALLESLEHSQVASVIAAVRRARQYEARLSASKDALMMQSSTAVDVNRFASGDVEYRRSIIMSMVAGLSDANSSGLGAQQALNNVLQLAVRYGIDRQEVYTSALVAFMQSGQSVADVQAALLSHKEVLHQQPASMRTAMKEQVYPALSGSDKDRLALYLQLLLETYNFDADAQAVKAHLQQCSAAVASLSSIAPAFNLKALFAADEAVCLPLKADPGFEGELRANITLSNVDALAVLAEQLPGIHLSQSNVRRILVEVVMTPALQSLDRVESMYGLCSPHVRQLSAADAVAIARIVAEEPRLHLTSSARLPRSLRTSVVTDALVAAASSTPDSAVEPTLSALRQRARLLSTIQSADQSTRHQKYLDKLDACDGSIASVQAALQQVLADGCPYGLLAQVVQGFNAQSTKEDRLPMLHELYRLVLADTLRPPDNSVNAVVAIVQSLSTTAAGIDAVRMQVYQQIRTIAQDDSLSTQVQVRIKLLETLKALGTASKNNAAHWAGWTPPQEVEKSGDSLLQFRTAAIVAAIWSGVQVPSLINVDTATVLFYQLWKGDLSHEQLDAVVSLLELWNDHLPGAAPGNTSPLHTSWHQLFEELAKRGELKRTVSLVVSASAKLPCLTPGEVDSLLKLVLQKASPTLHAAGMAQSFKLGLAQNQATAQKLAADELVQAITANKPATVEELCSAVDEQFLALALNSTIIPRIAANSLIANEFLWVLYDVAEAMSTRRGRESQSHRALAAVALPIFIASLVMAQQYAIAGALVLKHMRVHPALATYSAAIPALERFLQIYSRRRVEAVPDTEDLHAVVKKVASGLPSLCSKALRELKTYAA
eukprot:jgi/Chlat1/6821/Chrsp51S06512